MISDHEYVKLFCSWNSCAEEFEKINPRLFYCYIYQEMGEKLKKERNCDFICIQFV